MNKKRTFIYLVIPLALLIIVGPIIFQRNNKFLKEISAENYLQSMEDGYIYVGRPTWPHCKEFQPRLERTAEITNTPIIYKYRENR